MITVSLCMIVKNEESVLSRCLDSIKDLVEEIIIVDTGSTDSTKSIAAKYTDKVYDFEWISDFSAARNFSFSKATCDYIYIADADEYLDDAGRNEFLKLKECMVPEIEIVQMHYNTVGFDTVLNIQSEYRPKLFKRQREFTWIDPVHETVRIEPVVFDSDVVVTHAPESLHSGRDFSIFQKAIERDGRLSDRLSRMYAIELMRNADISDFEAAQSYFTELHDVAPNTESGRIAACVLCRYYRMSGNSVALLKYAMSDAVSGFSSEVCYDVGRVFYESGAYADAYTWGCNAHLNASPIIDIHSSGDEALRLMIDSLVAMEDDSEEAKTLIAELNDELENWSMPVEDTYL